MLGRLLSSRREELGLDVQDIARMTGMLPKQILALEADNHAYFIGGKREIERLIKLYAKKLSMPLEATLCAELGARQTSPDARNIEVAIPAFLIATSKEEPATSTKRRTAPAKQPE